MPLDLGWSTTLDLGTTGDWFVDATVGSSGDGTSLGTAFKTIAEAVAAASAGDTIRVKGGTYRETVVPISGVDDANRTKLLAYGTERPVISAGEVLTGWTQCTVGDEPDVGANYASLYKATVSTASIADGNALCLNIHEAGVKANQCVIWAGGDIDDKFYLGNNRDWYTADSVNVDGGGRILSYESATVTGLYTAAQIANGTLFGHTVPNEQFTSPISGVSDTTITIADQTHTYEDNEFRDRFSIVNVLPAIEQGQWGAKDNGDGTTTVYLWPTDPANLTADIEYSVRGNCIDITFVNHVTIRGFECRMPAGYFDLRYGIGITAYGTGQDTENVTIEHCRVAGSLSYAEQPAVKLVRIDNLRLRNVTVDKAQGGFGFFLSGYNDRNDTAGIVWFRDLDMQFNSVSRSEKAAYRFYTIRNAVVAFNYAEYCGYTAHANKMNFYERSHDVLIWGNSFVGCDGYITFQASSGLFFLFNEADGPLNSTDKNSRVFVDQNTGAAAYYSPPSSFLPANEDPDLGVWFVNNTAKPQPIALTGTADNAMSVTDGAAQNASVITYVLNNLAHGITVEAPTLIGQFEDNWTTGYGPAHTPNDVKASPTDVWVDPANGDFTIKPDATIRAAKGTSIVSLIEGTLKPRYQDRFEGWTLDVLGQTFDPSTPPIGAELLTRVLGEMPAGVQLRVNAP